MTWLSFKQCCTSGFYLPVQIRGGSILPSMLVKSSFFSWHTTVELDFRPTQSDKSNTLGGCTNTETENTSYNTTDCRFSQGICIQFLFMQSNSIWPVFILFNTFGKKFVNPEQFMFLSFPHKLNWLCPSPLKWVKFMPQHLWLLLVSCLCRREVELLSGHTKCLTRRQLQGIGTTGNAYIADIIWQECSVFFCTFSKSLFQMITVDSDDRGFMP